MIFGRIVLMNGRWERSFQNCGFSVRLSYTKLPFFKFPSNFLQWLTNLHKCLSSSTGNEKGIIPSWSQIDSPHPHARRRPFTAVQDDASSVHVLPFQHTIVMDQIQYHGCPRSNCPFCFTFKYHLLPRLILPSCCCSHCRASEKKKKKKSSTSVLSVK